MRPLERAGCALTLPLLLSSSGCIPVGMLAVTNHSPDAFPISTSVGARTMTYLPAHSGAFDGNVETSPIAYHFPATQLQTPALRTYGFEANVLVVPWRYVYAGLTAGIGWGQFDGAPIVANGLTVQPGVFPNVTQIAAGGVVGLRVPLGPVAIRAGATLGLDSLSLSQYASTSGSNALTATGSATGFLLEPRVDVDWFATPFCSAGVFVTMPYLEPEATNVGLSLTLHIRDYGG
jgi:hypothetical protein